MIRGSVDTITNKLSTGWVFSDAEKKPLSVEALINGQVVGEATANLFRPDLKEAGMGDGKCGFEIRFKSEVDSLYLPFVQFSVAGTDLDLRRWAGAGFREYFRALYQRYPRAGRSASVFGGLWTDRTDAHSVLKGRADIGLVALREANALARFIQDGVLTLACSSAANGLNGHGGTLADTVAHRLFSEEVLKTVRAVLDDNPVAVQAEEITGDAGEFVQMSALEELPSPAECLGLVFPTDSETTTVDVVRGSHRFPEFLPDGLSRWTRAAAPRTAAAALSPDLPVDRYQVPPGSTLLLGPGTLCRVRSGSKGAIRVLILPSRLSLLRFQEKAPRGEVTHESGARVWV